MASVIMMTVTQMPMVMIMADRAAAVQSAIQVALSNPKAALAHIGSMRAERWLETLSSAELWCIREVLVDLVDESRSAFPPRLLECLATNDARRAGGDLELGARHLLDPATFAFFARCNGFPRPLYLPDYDELVAADLLWRYGWSASVAGLAFDDWKTEHRREMLEVMKQISAISGCPDTTRGQKRRWLRRAG